MKTVVVQIGNSDNKLTQGDWANFAASMNLVVRSNVYRVHFCGGSDWDAPWQNACWVCEILGNQVNELQEAITNCRKSYSQDSVAVVVGDTTFI